MEKVKLSEIRAKYPMYSDLSDEQFLIGFRKKFYNDLTPGQFYNRIDFDTQRMDPTEGMSGFEKFMAGAGKSAVDLGRSAKRVANMVGIGDYDQAAAQADEALDKPLMKTGAGAAGKVAGDLALTFVPGLGAQQGITAGVTNAARVLPKAATALRVAAPYIGAAGSGALIGAATSPDDMSGGAAGGALAGAGGELLGRAATAAWNGGKAVLDPLTEAGRERVLKRTIERFATDPSKVRAAAANPEVLVPGVTPTLAEATGDVGIAQLQRAAQTASPDVASALAQARGRQVAGYRAALDNLSGTDSALKAAVDAREGAAQALYGRAFQSDAMRRDLARQASAQSAAFRGVGGAAPAQDLATPGLRDLMQRPMFKQAAEQARVLAANKGVDIGNPIESLQGLHYIKLALDDMANPQAASAMGRNAFGAVNETRAALTKELESVAPTYGLARQTYADMSRPVNQMEIARVLRDKAMPALTDLNPALSRVNANSYATALRNADQTARTATGMKSLGMADIMDPAQMQAVEGIGKDMARYAASQEAGKVAGSPTAQYLGGQNVIRQMLGPLGVPQGAMDAAAARIASGIANIPYKLTAGQTEQLLGRALTDPAVAAKILAAKDPKTIATILQPYAAQAAIQGQIQ